MKILVTGSSGYIGRRLIDRATKEGHQVIAASRGPVSHVAEWILFDLRNPLLNSFPENVDVVIHLAATTDGSDLDDNLELNAAKALIARSAQERARVIFVSSQTASAHAPTRYGRIKSQIEREVLAANGIVVRPGQVYGGAEAGLFGTLVNFVKHMPVIPAFIPAPKVQPIHVDDCVLGLLKLAYNSNVSSNIYRLGAKTPVPFTEFLGAIAKHRLRVRRFYLPVPVAFVRLFSKLLGVSKGPVSSLRRLESLFELPPMDTEADLCAIGLTLRSLHSGMHRSGSNRRRKLIREANCLLMYLLKERPGKSLIRRYVRMVETLHQGVPLGLSSWQYRWPAFLTLIDCPRFKRAVSGLEFGWRLDAAMLIAEASPQGAVRFLGSRESTNKYSSLVGIVTPLFYELLWRVLRALWPIRFPDQSKADQQDV